jgi:hypothetical protein
MAVKQGEVGRVIRLAAYYDMSNNTELKVIIRKPDGAKVEKTKTGGAVTLGVSNVTDTDLGALLANQYAEYVVESGIFDIVGRYMFELVYIDSSPSENLYGETVHIDVVRNLES